jgi:homoserine dehydrogenase
VNRTLLRLLREKQQELREREIAWRITGVATRRLGWLADSEGFDAHLLETGPTAALRSARAHQNVREWLQAARADVLFEATSLN